MIEAMIFELEGILVQIEKKMTRILFEDIENLIGCNHEISNFYIG